MICGLEWWVFISKKNAYRICNVFNLEVGKGYRTKRETRLNEDDLERTFRRKGKFKNLFIEVKKNGGRYILTVRGSLHRFYHGDNKGWFKGVEVLTAIQGLCDLFEIDSKDATVENLEVGINLPVLFLVYNYLKANLTYHKKKRFKEMDKKGVGFVTDKYSDFEIRLYEKDRNLLRFEVKYKSQSKLDLFGIRRLGDFNEVSINKLVNSLIQEWNEIIMRGEIDVLDKNSWEQIMTKHERDKLTDFSSIFYQQEYQKKLNNADTKEKERLRKQSARLKSFCVKLINEKGDQTHEKIGRLIKESELKFIAEWDECRN